MQEWEKQTNWSLIAEAAGGVLSSRCEFARRYLPAVRTCFRARWRDSLLRQHVDDAVQEVFLECFRDGGALQRAETGRDGGFRAFLRGVVNNVGHRIERRQAKNAAHRQPEAPTPEELPSGQESVSQALDRLWAHGLVLEAENLLAHEILSDGSKGATLLEILHLRYREGLTVREIAELRGMDVDCTYEQIRRARRHFRRCVYEVAARHLGGSKERIEKEIRRIRSLL